MAKITNKKDALAAVEAINSFDMESVGVKMPAMSAGTARNNLAKNGVKADSLSDKAVILVQSATVDMDKASNAMKAAALKMGVLSITNQWKAAVAPDGKTYKSENAFLRDFFPGYAVSTTSLYADVGKSIYIPILQKWPGYEGLEFLADMSPSNAKFLLATVKDDEKRALLPAAYNDAVKNGKLNQRVIVQLAKNIKEKVEGDEESSNANPDGAAVPSDASDAATIQAQLNGKLDTPNTTTEAKVRLYFQAALNDDNELASLVPEQYVSAFIGLLTQAAGDATVAMSLCAEMAKIATTAVSSK